MSAVKVHHSPSSPTSKSSKYEYKQITYRLPKPQVKEKTSKSSIFSCSTNNKD